ncbi:hypothetical protein KY338_05905 [Candidatus Woesearchaeota archaeon]|nr:hypothetical protein [Candidatus Woesearchaeota archaeon]MBW3006290.1 hypothetical protein [Candidatus Woesearchaeota archaeon]
MKKYQKTIESENEKRFYAHREFWRTIRTAMNGLPVIGHDMAWPGDVPGKDSGKAYEFDTGYVAITSKIYGPECYTEEAAVSSSIVFEAKLYGLGIRSDSEFGERVQKVFEEDLGFEPQN